MFLIKGGFEYVVFSIFKIMVSVNCGWYYYCYCICGDWFNYLLGIGVLLIDDLYGK